MKKFIIPILAFLLVSCSKDANNVVKNENILLGKWQFVQYLGLNIDNPIDGTFQPVTNGFILDLKEDGTFNSNEFVNDGYAATTYNIIESNNSIDLYLRYNNSQTNQNIEHKHQIKSVTTNELYLSFYETMNPDGNDCKYVKVTNQ